MIASAPDSNEFSKRLDSILIRKGLTKEKFAELIGVDVSTVYRWKNGDNEPNYTYLSRMVRALNLSNQELFGDR